MERAFSKKKDIWREQSTEIRRCDHLNNPGKGGIVSEKVILLFIGYDLGMVYGGEGGHSLGSSPYPTSYNYIIYSFSKLLHPPANAFSIFLEFIKTESRREENK